MPTLAFYSIPMRDEAAQPPARGLLPLQYSEGENRAAGCGEYRQAASLAEKDRKLVVNPQTNRVQNNESGHSRSKNDK